MGDMELKTVKIVKPEEMNFILGQTHALFVRSVRVMLGMFCYDQFATYLHFAFEGAELLIPAAYEFTVSLDQAAPEKTDAKKGPKNSSGNFSVIHFQLFRT